MSKAPIGMILAAGYGQRLKDLTYWQAKPGLELGGIPIIFTLLDMFYRAQIKDVLINLHYRAQSLAKLLRHYDKPLRLHLVFEPTLLGTGGGLFNALSKMGVRRQPLVLMHGDIFCDIDLKPLLRMEQFLSLVLIKNKMIEEYKKSVEIDRHNNIVTLGRFYQNGQPSDAGFFSGIHIFSEDAVAKFMSEGPQDLVKEVYPSWMRQGQNIHGHMIEGDYDDLGSPERIFSSNMAIFSSQRMQQFLNISERFEIESRHKFMGKNIEVPNGATICPPVIIADDVQIGEKATIGPFAILGKQAKVLSNAKIEHSVVMANTCIQKGEILQKMLALQGARIKIK